MHLIKEPMFLTFLLCKGRGVSYWLKWGDFIDKFWSLSEACLTHMRYSLKPWSWGLRPHDQRFAKTTACRHVNVEIWTFLDTHPSVTAYDFIDKFWSLSEHYNWTLRSMLNAYAVLAKTTACRHFNVEILTFLDAVPSVTAYNLLARFAHLYFVKSRPHGRRFAKTTGCRHFND